MNQMSKITVTANRRTYPWPNVPAIAICLDGCEPAYLDEAIKAGLMPTLARIRKTGTERTALSVIPSFTNPNNLSIATGRPPAIHGICGNYFFDRELGEEVMMNDPKYLRAGTVLAAFADVENALTASRRLARQTEHAVQRRGVLQRSLGFAHDRYEAGYASYLEELDAQRNLFQAELEVVKLRQAELENRVQLYKALGGGWQPNQKP